VRFLLVNNHCISDPTAGVTQSLRTIMEFLSGAGHECRILTTARFESAVTFTIDDHLREQGVRLLATSSHKGTALDEANFAPPVAILIGGEGAGLPRDCLAAMDEVVAIPHSPRVESLNAGVAASIVLYEAARQRKQIADC